MGNPYRHPISTPVPELQGVATIAPKVASDTGAITPEWCLRMAELEVGQEIGAGALDHPLRTKCELPPAGWVCTREPGHDGPCAAVASDTGAGLRWRLGYPDGVPGTPEYEPAPRICTLCNTVSSQCQCDTGAGLVTVEDGANSHVFDQRIMYDGECIAFADEPWASKIAAALATRTDATGGGDLLEQAEMRKAIEAYLAAFDAGTGTVYVEPMMRKALKPAGDGGEA